jgi:hypothetical protein
MNGRRATLSKKQSFSSCTIEIDAWQQAAKAKPGGQAIAL